MLMQLLGTVADFVTVWTLIWHLFLNRVVHRLINAGSLKHVTGVIL